MHLSSSVSLIHPLSIPSENIIGAPKIRNILVLSNWFFQQSNVRVFFNAPNIVIALSTLRKQCWSFLYCSNIVIALQTLRYQYWSLLYCFQYSYCSSNFAVAKVDLNLFASFFTLPRDSDKFIYFLFAIAVKERERATNIAIAIVWRTTLKCNHESMYQKTIQKWSKEIKSDNFAITKLDEQ